MTQAALDLREQLARLPEEDRAALADFLLDSLSPEYEARLEDEFEAELKRREEEILSGRAVGIPAEEVFDGLSNRYEWPVQDSQ
jgi:putative addiction module component (TIGR02574 family)